MRRPVGIRQLLRDGRERERAAERSGASSRAAGSRSAADAAPSAALRPRRDVPEAEWGGRDLLACYAAAYAKEMGSEDPVLRSAAGRDRSAGTLSGVMRVLEPGESPAEYVRWAVGECLRGRGYPSDRTPSVGALVYDWILLKRWRSRARRGGAQRVRGADGGGWEEA